MFGVLVMVSPGVIFCPSNLRKSAAPDLRIATLGPGDYDMMAALRDQSACDPAALRP